MEISVEEYKKMVVALENVNNTAIVLQKEQDRRSDAIQAREEANRQEDIRQAEIIRKRHFLAEAAINIYTHGYVDFTPTDSMDVAEQIWQMAVERSAK